MNHRDKYQRDVATAVLKGIPREVIRICLLFLQEHGPASVFELHLAANENPVIAALNFLTDKGWVLQQDTTYGSLYSL